MRLVNRVGNVYAWMAHYLRDQYVRASVGLYL